MHRSRLALLVLSCVSLSVTDAAAEPAVERGRYLVNAVLACGNCHTPKDAQGRPVEGMALAGGTSFDTPAFTATASNITPDRDTGIGTWTDEEIKRALVEGVRPDHGRLAGIPLAAVMSASFYKALTPRDLDAVVAYLRSLPARRNEIALPVYKKPVRRQPYPDAEKPYDEESLSDPVTRGRYLGTVALCMECHSTFAAGVSDYAGGLGKGGRVFRDGVVATNITSDRNAGIGAWSDDEIKRALTKGIARDGKPLKPPMAFTSYAGVTDTDLDAIIAWLRTVPAANDDVAQGTTMP
jgi:mono/diheme cytochrome c family protein